MLMLFTQLLYNNQNCSHICFVFVFLFLSSFQNSCGCSTAKSMTPPQETFFCPLNGTEHRSQPSLTTRDRELVSVLEIRIEPGDLNPRPLTPQSEVSGSNPRVLWPTLHFTAAPDWSLLFSPEKNPFPLKKEKVL